MTLLESPPLSGAQFSHWYTMKRGRVQFKHYVIPSMSWVGQEGLGFREIIGVKL